jgi:hypothetical protein
LAHSALEVPWLELSLLPRPPLQDALEGFHLRVWADFLEFLPEGVLLPVQVSETDSLSLSLRLLGPLCLVSQVPQTSVSDCLLLLEVVNDRLVPLVEVSQLLVQLVLGLPHGRLCFHPQLPPTVVELSEDHSLLIFKDASEAGGFPEVIPIVDFYLPI